MPRKIARKNRTPNAPRDTATQLFMDEVIRRIRAIPKA